MGFSNNLLTVFLVIFIWFLVVVVCLFVLSWSSYFCSGYHTQRLTRKASGAKKYCALETLVQDWESGTLTFLSVIVSDFQGPSTRYCIDHTVFFLCRRGKIWFSGRVVGYSFLCCGVSGWGFLLFTVHVYSED